MNYSGPEPEIFCGYFYFIIRVQADIPNFRVTAVMPEKSVRN